MSSECSASNIPDVKTTERLSSQITLYILMSQRNTVEFNIERK